MKPKKPHRYACSPEESEIKIVAPHRGADQPTPAPASAIVPAIAPPLLASVAPPVQAVSTGRARATAVARPAPTKPPAHAAPQEAPTALADNASRAKSQASDLARLQSDSRDAKASIAAKRESYSEETRQALIAGTLDITYKDIITEWTRLVKLHFPEWAPLESHGRAVLDREIGHARNVAKTPASRSFPAMARFFERLPSLATHDRRLVVGQAPDFAIFALNYLSRMHQEIVAGLSIEAAAQKDKPSWVAEKEKKQLKMTGPLGFDGIQRRDLKPGDLKSGW